MAASLQSWNVRYKIHIQKEYYDMISLFEDFVKNKAYT